MELSASTLLVTATPLERWPMLGLLITTAILIAISATISFGTCIYLYAQHRCILCNLSNESLPAAPIDAPTPNQNDRRKHRPKPLHLDSSASPPADTSGSECTCNCAMTDTRGTPTSMPGTPTSPRLSKSGSGRNGSIVVKREIGKPPKWMLKMAT